MRGETSSTPSLLVALDSLGLLADVRPDKFDRATVRWQGRLEVEAAAMTLVESQFALTALASLCAGEPRLSRSCAGSCAGYDRR